MNFAVRSPRIGVFFTKRGWNWFRRLKAGVLLAIAASCMTLAAGAAEAWIRGANDPETDAEKRNRLLPKDPFCGGAQVLSAQALSTLTNMARPRKPPTRFLPKLAGAPAAAVGQKPVSGLGTHPAVPAPQKTTNTTLNTLKRGQQAPP